MDSIKLFEDFLKIPQDNGIYLLSRFTPLSGMFANNKKLLYLVKDIGNLIFENIETEFLSLQTHIFIHSVENYPTFEDGYYNAIVYKGEVSFDNPNLTSFIDLCSIHSKNIDELKFKEFFYSLISLFQLPQEQQFKNALGLYGELKFMQYIQKKMNVDISLYWHKSGSYSKFDFSTDKINFEVKSILSNEIVVPIKHDQLFNEHDNYLATINCEKCDDGETIKEVIMEMQNNDDHFFKNINFSVNIAKELKRISVVDMSEIKFRSFDIRIFEAERINPFYHIPIEVSELKYSFDLSEMTAISESNLRQLILS